MPQQKQATKPRQKIGRPQIIQMATQLGVIRAKIISPSTVETGEWVRLKCQFGCGGYGTSLHCPPHSPRPAETRQVLDGYKRGVLFEADGGEVTRIAAQLERALFLAGSYKAFGFGAGPCGLCKKCAFEKGCRHPDKARPAVEACGIDVFATVRKHGFDIEVVCDRSDRQHYFGLVLIEPVAL